jgi:hypothetical protein
MRGGGFSDGTTIKKKHYYTTKALQLLPYILNAGALLHSSTNASRTS